MSSSYSRPTGGPEDAAAALPARIVLASASPRRRELLAQIGIEADVVPARIDEAAIRHDDPVSLAIELARAKAAAVLDRLTREDLAGRPLLAADTVVAVAGEILEKPADRAEARRMLELLSGRTHLVVTGVAVASARIAVASAPADQIGLPAIHARSCETHVTFATLSGSQIDAYLDADEWHDVAGGYRVQGLAARYVTHLSGSYSNVVGLPLHLVYAILTGTRTDGTGNHP